MKKEKERGKADMTTTSASENRVIFLDNLRYFFVICIVFLHSAGSYSNVLSWWPVIDKNTSIAATMISAFIDASAILILFFIAGFFAIPTMEKHGIGSFLKGKMKRLGIPWLICILVICPVLPLVYHFTRDGLVLSMSYWDRWLLLMHHTAEFNVGVIKSMDLLKKNDQFFQRYMWFISLLLLFFVLFGAAYRLKRNWFTASKKSETNKEKSGMSVWGLIFGFGSLTFFLSAILIRIMFYLYPENHNPEAWFTLGNIIQFQPSRLPAYIGFFILGIITYKNNWAGRGKFSGSMIAWIISFVLLFIAYCASAYFFLQALGKEKMILGTTVFFSRNLLSVAILGLFLTFGYKYWNRPSKINSDLAANSYNIYLAHYIFVVGFQLMLFSVPGIPGFFKYGIVAILSLFCAYCASRFLIEPHPRITVALMFIMLVVMFVFIRP
jgi:glucans biosynthesis protein C